MKSRKEKAKGTFHEAEGMVKEVTGKIADSPKLEDKGKTEKMAGKADLTPQISKRAYELYEEHGRKSGSAVQDWTEAEREIQKGEGKAGPKPGSESKPEGQAKVKPKPAPGGGFKPSPAR